MGTKMNDLDLCLEVV